jgi:hypothetical protein
MDVSRVRNGPEAIGAVLENPLMATQDLSRNAAHDEALLQELLQRL